MNQRKKKQVKGNPRISSQTRHKKSVVNRTLLYLEDIFYKLSSEYIFKMYLSIKNVSTENVLKKTLSLLNISCVITFTSIV